MPPVHIDLSWILEVVERAGAGDPAIDDLGVAVAAVERHRAEVMEHAVYDGPYARAAALVHTLGRCRWLERSNLTVAAAVGAMYLAASGINTAPDKTHLRALADELHDHRCTAARIVSLLRTWPAEPEPLS